MKPTAREYAQAQDKGAAARRSTRPQTENPWWAAATERDRILRDAWDDAWLQEDNRRRR
jgi:hypothetical protein